jgi:hypothetical protein
MANTYVKIATVSVGVLGASTIDFTSIPATYTDLCVKLSARNTGTAGGAYDAVVRFNSDSGSNYSIRAIQGSGAAASSFSSGTQTYLANIVINSGLSTTSTFANTEFYIPNYAGANQKSVSIDTVQENNITSSATMRMIAGLWTGTAAISSINIFQDFAQYSTATLYGISKS